jgi:hypothetical protein
MILVFFASLRNPQTNLPFSNSFSLTRNPQTNSTTPVQPYTAVATKINSPGYFDP